MNRFGCSNVRCEMIVGYARVSTDGQTLDAQQAALRDAGCARVFYVLNVRHTTIYHCNHPVALGDID